MLEDVFFWNTFLSGAFQTLLVVCMRITLPPVTLFDDSAPRWSRTGMIDEPVVRVAPRGRGQRAARACARTGRRCIAPRIRQTFTL